MMFHNTASQEKSVFEAILARRSVRAYAQTPVARSAIETLLEAAVRAPTAMHEEPWAFVVVEDKSLLKRISDVAKPLFAEEVRRRGESGHAFEHFTHPDFDLFYGAGALIVICAKLEGPFVAADCWLAAENLLLAACAMGLGSCVIGSAVSTLNTAEMKAALGMPGAYTAIAPVIVGIPSGDTPATSRQKPKILAWRP